MGSIPTVSTKEIAKSGRLLRALEVERIGARIRVGEPIMLIMHIDELLKYYQVFKDGTLFSTVSNRNLVHSTNSSGYPFVRLNRENKSYSFFSS